MLLEYFTKGTEGTKTGDAVGMEIETDFLTEDGTPISGAVSRALLEEDEERPNVCVQKLELGRQKIELSIDPQANIHLLLEAAEESLRWLYGKARKFGAFPFFGPEIVWNEELLWVQEERDALWVELDGRQALEHLCRCSAVQYTVDVNPGDVISMINDLWDSELHMRDYDANFRKWVLYMTQTRAKYRPDRFAGPAGFNNMQDYVYELAKHDVVMHNGQPVRLNVYEVPDLKVDLFLRSVWWHYRLRRYGSKLAIEMRPFARRGDKDFLCLWKEIARVTGL